MSGLALSLLPDSFDAMIVAGGFHPPRRLLKAVESRSRFHIAVDGGVRLFRLAGITPHVVIGDLDSASREDLIWARKRGARILKQREQATSDFEKALRYCTQRKLKNLALLAAEGDRVDHVLHSASRVFAFRSLKPLLIYGSSVAHVLSGRTSRELTVPARHTISWFGCPRADGSTLSGVRWPFENRTLEWGAFQSLSNTSKSDALRASQRSGKSLLIISLRPE
ncbi:thiamine diphosphokinase [bacterium]|nr:thiamine diphosphokinase [bacterium]